MRSHLLDWTLLHTTHLSSLREGFWLAFELSQQAGDLNREHSNSQGGEEVAPSIQLVGQRTRGEIIFHHHLAPFLKLVCLDKSLPEIPYVHCPRLKSEST